MSPLDGSKWLKGIPKALKVNIKIPIKNGNVDPDCRVYHLSNYYANESGTNMGTIKFAYIIQ